MRAPLRASAPSSFPASGKRRRPGTPVSSVLSMEDSRPPRSTAPPSFKLTVVCRLRERIVGESIALVVVRSASLSVWLSSISSCPPAFTVGMISSSSPVFRYSRVRTSGASGSSTDRDEALTTGI